MSIFNKWWPSRPDRAYWGPKLEAFYADNDAYHAMTARKSESDPQIECLQALIEPGKAYAEVGCGSGMVCSRVGRLAKVFGYDISPLAVERAKARCEGMDAEIAVAPAEALPLPDLAVDGAYSFEVLEHVWDPIAVLAEMARIVKPGGFVLISTPNHLSLDLQVPKRPAVRWAEALCAHLRHLQDRMTGRLYLNLQPDIDRDDVYPDCDMISSLIPSNLHRAMEQVKLQLQFLNTYYMANHASANESPSLAFQRNDRHPIRRYYGDHILLLAIKR